MSNELADDEVDALARNLGVPATDQFRERLRFAIACFVKRETGKTQALRAVDHAIRDAALRAARGGLDDYVAALTECPSLSALIERYAPMPPSAGHVAAARALLRGKEVAGKIENFFAPARGAPSDEAVEFLFADLVDLARDTGASLELPGSERAEDAASPLLAYAEDVLAMVADRLDKEPNEAARDRAKQLRDAKPRWILDRLRAAKSAETRPRRGFRTIQEELIDFT